MFSRSLKWQLLLVLFVATAVSVLYTGMGYEGVEGVSLWQGWKFAVPLLGILVTHELGHYVAAVIHRVPASLPMFIPMPISPFGTMGAVISMPEPIRSRNALLDIGAAGPLAGMAVAIPVLIIGLSQSEVRPLEPGGLLEGQSLLYLLLKRLVVGPIPEGHDVYLTSTAFAGWTGLLVTTLNLLPVGQLDGGHVAYALFGERQNTLGRIFHATLPVMFLVNLAVYRDSQPGMVWLIWFALLAVLRRASGGVDHPPTDEGEQLSPGRKAIAIGTLVLFVLIFMPTPLRLG